MIYSGPVKNQYGAILKCPICQNEDIAANSNICKICGSTLKNHCYGVLELNHQGTNYYNNLKGCKAQLDDNARFCPICGATSFYYAYRLLEYWEYEYKRTLSVDNQTF